MSEYSHRTIAAVVVVVLLTSFAAIEINNILSPAATVSKSSQSPPPSYYSITTPSGLKLDMKLNATTIAVGSALGAQISFFNPLNHNLSVSAMNDLSNTTIAAWTSDDFVCDGNSLNALAAYALFQGSYSTQNVSSAGTPLWLAPPVSIPCMATFGSGSAVFLPNSSNASLGGEGGAYHMATNATTEYCESTTDTHCPVGTSLFGYWIPVKGYLDPTAATLSSPYFHYLSPGQYTLVVEDEWNQTICAPFLVSAT